MKDNGLFAFCGVPGSGKTLTCVKLALKHYKKENSPIKYYIAYFKYICLNNKFIKLILNIIKKYNFIKIIKLKYYNFCLKRLSKENINELFKFISFILKFVKFFVKVFLILYMFFTPSLFLKVVLFVIVFLRKKIKKFFNSLDYKYYCLFPYKKINNIYSTFPILLDKKRGIYSHKVSLWDLNNLYSFYPNSIIILDELQLFVDSDEYKDRIITDTLRKIGNYFQAHRHFAIKNIFVTSQGVTRIFKKCRDVCSGYLKLNRVFKFPFLPFGFISGTLYYDIDYFGKYIPRDKEERKKLPFDYKKIRMLCNLDKVYSSYDSRYLANMNFDKPLLNRGLYDSLRTEIKDLNVLYKNPRGE